MCAAPFVRKANQQLHWRQFVAWSRRRVSLTVSLLPPLLLLVRGRSDHFNLEFRNEIDDPMGFVSPSFFLHRMKDLHAILKDPHAILENMHSILKDPHSHSEESSCHPRGFSCQPRGSAWKEHKTSHSSFRSHLVAEIPNPVDLCGISCSKCKHTVALPNGPQSSHHLVISTSSKLMQFADERTAH